MSKLRSYILGLLIITGFSNTLLAQKFQASLSALSLDFNRETKWNPIDSDLEYPSAVGLTVTFPTSQYLSFGANLKYGTVKKATDDLIRELNGEQLFSFSGASRLQKIHSRYAVNPFLQFAVGGQTISKEDGIKAIVNLGLGTDIRLYKKLNLHISTSFTREVSRNRYFIDYGLGLTWAIHDGSPQLDRIQDEYVEERNDFDGDGLADVDDDCPDLAGTVASGGCPDRDEDGVPDVRDLCPDEAGLIGNDGCPLYTGTDSTNKDLNDAEMLDSDGDGVVDAEDECPDQYGNLQNLGCPEPDGDNDGVIDRDDLCPETPGNIDNAGCPDDLDITSLLTTNPTEANEIVDEEVTFNEDKTVSPSDLPTIEEDGDKVGNAPDLAEQENKTEGLEPLKRSENSQEVNVDAVAEVNEENLKGQGSGMPPAGTEPTTKDEVESAAEESVTLQDPVTSSITEDEEQIATEDEEQIATEDQEQIATEDQEQIATEDQEQIATEDEVGEIVVSDLPEIQASDSVEELIVEKSVDELETPEKGKEQEVTPIVKEQTIPETKSTQEVTIKTMTFQDRDGDGIADHIDPCPDLFGTLTNKGCPELSDTPGTESVPVTSNIVSMDYLSEVRFEPGLASIQRKYIAVMDEIAEYMHANPELKLEIFGHTDSQGPDKLNDVLSERRAKACYIYLRVKGVAFDRMTYTGLGERQPKVDNLSSSEMELNRRVVFRFKG